MPAADHGHNGRRKVAEQSDTPDAPSERSLDVGDAQLLAVGSADLEDVLSRSEMKDARAPTARRQAVWYRIWFHMPVQEEMRKRMIAIGWFEL